MNSISYQELILKVILLGAGASKSYTQSPTGLRMPIANDFFQTFYQTNLASNPWVLIGKLCEFLTGTKEIEDPYEYLTAGVDIEVLHSEIALALDNATSDDGGLERTWLSGAYTELIFIFISTLNIIASGPTSESHLSIAHTLDAEDVIITFNWDTLMEKALAEACDWSSAHGYGFKPVSIFRDEWVSTNKGDQVKQTKLLKLHGSANWLTGFPMYTKEGPVLGYGMKDESVFLYEKSCKPYATYKGRYMGGYEDFTYGYYPPNLIDVPGIEAPKDHIFVQGYQQMPWVPEGNGLSEGQPSIPLIIPPVHNKKYERYGSLFDSIWSQASAALSNCYEIIVIGYSFPPTDTRSLELFRDAFLKRATFPKITIIDPSPSRPLERFQRDLGIPLSHLRIHKGPFEGEKTFNKLDI